MAPWRFISTDTERRFYGTLGHSVCGSVVAGCAGRRLRRGQAAHDDRRPVPLQARRRSADQPRRQAASSTSSAASIWTATRSSSTLWLAADRQGRAAAADQRAAKKDRHPRWSPDGKHILFESNRSGDNQLWVIDLGGGEARQLTTISTEAEHRHLVARRQADRLRLGRLARVLRQAVQGERRRSTRNARRRSRRARSRRRSSRSSSSATGTTTSRTSGSTCS